MKFSVGYQPDELFRQSVLRHADAVRELYFPWGGFSTGRGVSAGSAFQRKLEEDLTAYSAAGLSMNWLLNGNCYGRYAQSRAFFQKVGDGADELKARFGLRSVTTASPLIARFLKNNFPELEIRASVNMETGTPEAVEYLLPWFDSFYLKREYNYDFARLKRMREFTRARGKKLFLLANSGCLNFCSARTFHDNLVAHQHEIAEMDNALDFHGICHLFLKDGELGRNLLSHTNFIRPEDVARFEPWCDGMKLATRTSRNPSLIVEAYASGFAHGNLLDLTEPAHAGHFHPNILLSGRIPADWLERRWRCGKTCESCGWCAEIQARATVSLNPEF